MKVNEIFYSIQGEGQKTGFPCVFLRLFGCNLNCKWCDTLYAKAPSKDFKEMSVEKVANIIEKYGINYVCITGGEPLLQKEEVKKLIGLFPDYLFEINTNGSLPIWPQNNIRWVVDYKLPSSNEWGKFLLDNLEHMDKDDLIFVIRNKRDYIIAREVAKFIKKVNKNVVCNFSPCWGEMPKQRLVRWILRDKLDVKLSLQIHKIIWSPGKRKV